MKYFIKRLFILIFLGQFGCKSESTSLSIGEVVDVFELKEGEPVTRIINNEAFEFSIKDIVDDVIDCTVVDFKNPDDGYKVRIHVLLEIKSKYGKTRTRVSSRMCGAKLYRDNGQDMQDVYDILSEMVPVDHFYYNTEFEYHFGEGINLKHTLLHINIAKAVQKNLQSSMHQYKFIFITTNLIHLESCSQDECGTPAPAPPPWIFNP